MARLTKIRATGARSRFVCAALLVSGLVVSAVATATGYFAIGGFSGPLFGLTSSYAGKLLVADASTGIIPTYFHKLGEPIPLPGVTDVDSTYFGTLWATTGAGGNPQADTGQGLHLIGHDGQTKVANLWDFEVANNPDGLMPYDSNPFDVHALGGFGALVADAGANALLRAKASGDVEVLAVFPSEVVPTANIKALGGCPDSGAPFCGLPDAIPAQPVPTSIAVDHYRGYTYVGELKGFPAPTGESNIWRVAPHASWAQCGSSPDCEKVFDGGFTSIIDLAMGPDGWLYVAEFDVASWAAVEIFGTPAGGRISACHVKYEFCYEVASGIDEMTSIAFDAHGALWATRHALVPDQAEVVLVRPGWWSPWWGKVHY